jgi:hypothetical protein
VARPFAYDELVARIRAVLRRSSQRACSRPKCARDHSHCGLGRRSTTIARDPEVNADGLPIPRPSWRLQADPRAIAMVASRVKDTSTADATRRGVVGRTRAVRIVASISSVRDGPYEARAAAPESENELIHQEHRYTLFDLPRREEKALRKEPWDIREPSVLGPDLLE